MERSNRAGLLVAFVSLACGSSTHAQVNNEAYRDFFLFGRFGEVCTMCEVTVLCGATVPPPRVAVPAEPPLIPTPGHYTVYHLQTRTFWSQIATIWEWFVANFSSESLAGRGHTRPVYVYTVDDGVWRPLRVIEGRLRLEPPLLELGEAHIDRVTRQWVAADSGEQLGYCRRLPLWDALAEIAAHSGPVGEVELTAPSPELPR